MPILPYKLLLANLRLNGSNIVISKSFLDFLLQNLLLNYEFNEEDYLRLNPDVAASVRQGEWESGKAHYIARGYFEDREGALKPLIETWYLRANPDVALAVKAGDWSSGESHYHERGMFEWRAPNKEMQETFVVWKNALGSVDDPTPPTESGSQVKKAKEN